MRTLVLVAIIFFARITSAQVLISEIMYDPKGTDASAGGEWIEVQNNSPVAIDLTKWFFFENNTNHSITADGVSEVPPGGYAVISKDITAFKNYFTSFPSQLFKASFSLVDSEEIAMKSGNKSSDPVVDSVLYNSDQGAKNDGNSLQKVGGVWKAATPTPGASNSSAQAAPDAPASPQGDQGVTVANEAVSTTAKNNVSYFPVEPQIFTKITTQTQTVSVGAATTFTGRVWGLKKEPIENARTTWTFGDGASAEGATVAHTYYYPGEYTVIIDASSGYYAASDRVRIVAIAPLLALRTGGDEARSFVAVENRGNDELDLSEWQVYTQGKIFMLPKNTIIGAHKILTLASEVTGLMTPTGSIVSLHFPNGSAVPLQEEVKAVAVNTKSVVVATETKKASALRPASQTATAIEALTDLRSEKPITQNDTLWMWYVGVAFLGVFVALGLRLARGGTPKPETLTADDFDITDEDEDKKDDLF